MSTTSRRLLFWTPRVLSLAFAIFLSLFALDVFQEGHGFWRTLAALMIHLIPTALVLLVLLVAWRWEWVGALGYAGLALWYAKGVWRRHPDWVVVIAGPMLVMAALFLVNWLKHAELRGRR
jgi:lysylphosphatidylglycerol synthetase-like protein (DUF2156 family)